MRYFTFLIFTLIAFLPLKSHAEDLLLGTVQQVEGKTVQVMSDADRHKVMPEELVTLQSRIPGIDEVVQSGKGYIESSQTGTLTITITDGDPAIGDEVILHKNEFLNGDLTDDVDKWRKLSYGDIRGRAFDKKEDHHSSAVCAMAYMLANGDGVAKDEYASYVSFKYATEHFENPPADCAAEHGIRMLTGDPVNKPPKWSIDLEKGLYWVKYAAERGSYMGMSWYAMSLETLGESGEAEKWFKKAIEIEPENHKGKAQKLWDAVRR